ncbi:hypothetical protein R1flu_007998 [Riccia fluitans]|uniref:Uncharacterized protein n=1 Tax=Riccia fluitans TaxID=41844 RepID=A0ABD1YAH0_9MARC
MIVPREPRSSLPPSTIHLAHNGLFCHGGGIFIRRRTVGYSTQGDKKIEEGTAHTEHFNHPQSGQGNHLGGSNSQRSNQVLVRNFTHFSTISKTQGIGIEGDYQTSEEEDQEKHRRRKDPTEGKASKDLTKGKPALGVTEEVEVQEQTHGKGTPKSQRWPRGRDPLAEEGVEGEGQRTSSGEGEVAPSVSYPRGPVRRVGGMRIT